jgi:hypothetical protein
MVNDAFWTMTKEKEFLALVGLVVRARTPVPQNCCLAARRAARRIPPYVPAQDAAAVFVRWLYQEGCNNDRALLKALRPDEP